MVARHQGSLHACQGSCAALHLQVMQSFLDESLISLRMLLVLKSHTLGVVGGSLPGSRCAPKCRAGLVIDILWNDASFLSSCRSII